MSIRPPYTRPLPIPWPRLIGAVVTLGVVGAIGPSALVGQDVEMFGEHYGTRPPAGYYETLRLDPTAYRFKRGFRPDLRFDSPFAPGGGGPALDLGPRSAPVEGAYRFPLLLGLYADSPEPATPFTRDEVEDHFFEGPNSQGKTLPEFFDEVSFGRLDLSAETTAWTRSTLTAEEVQGNNNGLTRGDGVYEFIWDLLGMLEADGMDWSDFDNDGPDGVPNSGDDDGFVDLIAVVHPTAGGECTAGSDDVWSHYWTLSGASESPQPGIYETSTAAAGGGNLFIDDYVIVPVRGCDGNDLNGIGTLAHEIGHGFGLPDLYNTRSPSVAGIGRWGLMGSGSWGCSDDADSPAKPCQMMAWTKAAMGWVDVTVLDPDVDHGVLTLDPVQTGNTVYRVDARDGSGDYFLLENRQAIGSDSDVPAPGLLVWRIDQEKIDDSWRDNIVNGTSSRMGVWLQQADGLNHLGRAGRGRGDAGDPYPGSSNNTQFHAGSFPIAETHEDNAAGVTILDIEQVGQQVRFRLLTTLHTVTLAQDNGPDGSGFVVDGGPVLPGGSMFDSAPFQSHTIEAVTPDLGTGFRTPFLEWEDGSSGVRNWVTQFSDAVLTASYGLPEVRFDIALDGGVPDVVPATIETDPASDEGWVRLDEDVTVRAVPQTGFGFLQWSGDLEGEPNPTVVHLTEPGSAGAAFEVIMEARTDATEVQFPAATDQSIEFFATDANEPVVWTFVQGNVPPGMIFDGTQAKILGAAKGTGTYPVTVRVTDALGLQDEVDVTMTVTAPTIAAADAAAVFTGGTPPSQAVQNYLDYQGNNDGVFDLADFRIYVLQGASGGGR